jgi:hypothetical protein
VRGVPPVVTTNATIMCIHGGRVMLVPKQTSVQVQGGMVLCEGDLVGAPIVGCAQPPTIASKPCTLVVSTLPGGSSPRVTVAGRPAHIATLSGITDGVPPGAIMVASPGQMAVQAS